MSRFFTIEEVLHEYHAAEAKKHAEEQERYKRACGAAQQLIGNIESFSNQQSVQKSASIKQNVVRVNLLHSQSLIVTVKYLEDYDLAATLVDDNGDLTTTNYTKLTQKDMLLHVGRALVNSKP